MLIHVSLRRMKSCLLAATMLSAAIAVPAFAQDAGTAEPTDASQTEPTPQGAQTVVDDVVVTARKREESLQSVPVTITAFSSAALEKTDTRNIFDLATRTPGLYFGTTGGRNGGNKLQIRNLSTGTSGGSKASAFIDGVFVSGDYSSTALANLDRIEVLKGPQSAYFGRSTFVGAVNFVTKDPGDTFTGKIDAITATLGEYDLSGFITTPIYGDKLSNTISARYFEFGGPDYWVNRDGYHLGDQRTFAVTDKLVFRPIDGLTIRAYGSYVHDRDHIPQTSYAPINTRNLKVTRPDGTVSYYYQGATNIQHDASTSAALYHQRIRGYINKPGVERKQYRGVLSFDADVAGQTLSGFAAFGDEKLQNNFDGFYLGAQIETAPDAYGVPRQYAYNSSNVYSFTHTKDRQYEIRLSSPGDWRLRYLVGYNKTRIFGNSYALFDPIRPDGTHVNAAPVVSTNNRNTILGNPSNTDSVFGALYFDVTDALKVSAELRRQWDHISVSLLPTAFAPTPFSAKAEFKSTLPRFNIQYQPTKDLNVYAVYSIGNNPGGFNSNVAPQFLPAGVPQAFLEEKLKNYEVGIKTTWLNGRLVFNLAAYHMDWSPQQVLQTYVTLAPAPGNIAALTTATASSTVNGFEAELDMIPADGLSLRATAGYGKAKYKDYCSSNYYALTGIATGIGCRSVKGFQQEGTPALQLGLFADYTHDIADGVTGYLRGDMQYQSRVYMEEFNYAWVAPAYLAGLRVGAEFNGLTVEGFVRNLFDDDHSARFTRATYQAVGGNNSGNLVTPVPAGTLTAYPAVAAPAGSGVAVTAAGAAGNQSIADTARRPRQIGVRFGYKF